MAKQHVGNTALGAATCRLIEQFQPEDTRLFTDPVVKDLVGTPIRALMQFDQHPQLHDKTDRCHHARDLRRPDLSDALYR